MNVLNIIRLHLFFYLLVCIASHAKAEDVIRRDIPANNNSNCKVVTYYRVSYNMENEKGIRNTWDGKCSGGYIQGYGQHIQIRPNGETRTTSANYINGMEQGPGISIVDYIDSRKIVLSGIYKDGLLVYGTRTYTDPSKDIKTVYEGPFLNGQMSGKGTLYAKIGSNVSKYTGDFLNNKKNGWGSIYIYDNGVRWAGPFANDLKNGTGRYVSDDGRAGVMQFANGEKIDEQPDSPADLSVEQIQQLLPQQQKMVPFSCTTVGSFTSCN